MSAARSIYPYSSLVGLKMTAEEYLALGETHERTELLNGVVICMSPSPIPRHWKVMEEILIQFAMFRRSGGGAADVYSDIDLKIRDLAVLRPDISVYARPTPSVLPERLTEAPDLVVEILSPGSEAYDLITKKDEYEQRGVKEYWVIDPKDARLRAWHLQQGKLVESQVAGDSFSSHVLPGFMLDLGAIAKAIGRTGT